jgi:trimeric autotransporter adhesin
MASLGGAILVMRPGHYSLTSACTEGLLSGAVRFALTASLLAFSITLPLRAFTRAATLTSPPAAAQGPISAALGRDDSQTAELTESDGVANDEFGYSVALSSDGNTALVGTPFKNIGTNHLEGAAYVFTYTGGVWRQQQKLTASDGAIGDEFGSAVALSSDGNTALVGAPSPDGSNPGPGAVYVFTRSNGTWSQQQKLTASDGIGGAEFGNSVALSGDGNTALIGSPEKGPYQQTAGPFSAYGAAYVFTRAEGSWSEQQELAALDGAYYDRLGSAVSLSSDGKMALAGTPGKINSAGYNGVGAAYVFTNTGESWSQQQKLTASDGAAYDEFGSALTLSGDGSTVIAGAPGKTVGLNSDEGAAYVFAKTDGSWSQQQKLTVPDEMAFDEFGSAVALSSNGNTALLGDRWYGNGCCSPVQGLAAQAEYGANSKN